MPEITRFNGIAIRINYREHNPPHFHAKYGDYSAAFDIRTLEILEGSLPSKETALVLEWAEPNKEALLKMWNDKKVVQLPPLRK